LEDPVIQQLTGEETNPPRKDQNRKTRVILQHHPQEQRDHVYIHDHARRHKSTTAAETKSLFALGEVGYMVTQHHSTRLKIKFSELTTSPTILIGLFHPSFTRLRKHAI